MARTRRGPRAYSAASKLIDLSPVQPIVDMRKVEGALGISDEAARLGIARLERSGLLTEVSEAKAPEGLLEWRSRQLASLSPKVETGGRLTGRLNTIKIP